MDRLVSMSVFVTAADFGSFAAAADATGLSATMVGKHVQSLEARLGVRLLNRTTRRQSLTEFGRAYYDRCKLILEEAAAADALASDHLNMPHGTLRVTMPALLGRICVAPLLLELTRRFASLRLEMSLQDPIIDLAGGAYDLSVRTGSVEERPGLMTKPLGSHRMLVCASPAYLQDRGVPRSLEDLPAHTAVMYARPDWYHDWLFRDEQGRTVEVSLPFRVQLDDMAAVTDAARKGFGLAWIPSWLARSHLDAGTLIEVLKDQPSFTFDNYAVWPKTRHLPLKVRMAIDLLATELPNLLRSADDNDAVKQVIR